MAEFICRGLECNFGGVGDVLECAWIEFVFSACRTMFLKLGRLSYLWVPKFSRRDRRLRMGFKSYGRDSERSVVEPRNAMKNPSLVGVGNSRWACTK